MNRKGAMMAFKAVGQPFRQLLDGIETAKFNGLLDETNTCLSVADVLLEIGAIVQPLSNQHVKFMVVDTAFAKIYEDHTIVKLGMTGTVSRILADGPKDTFGRASNDPVIIYTNIPLHQHTTQKAKEDSTLDRSVTRTSYEFSTADTFTVEKNDRLVIGKLTLIVTTLVLAPSGLCRFMAEATI